MKVDKCNLKIHIFVPVFNRSKITKRFIENIHKQSFTNFNLYIIDDKSEDDTPKIVRKFSAHDKRINLIRTKGDSWWAGSIAYGLKKIFDKGLINSTDYVAFMNDDISFGKNLLEELLKVLKNNPENIISPVRVNNKKIISSGSKIVSWPLSISSRPLKGRLFSRDKSQPLVDIDFIGANCTIFPGKLINEIGFPNFMKLPHYHADGEYFYRAKKINYKIYLCPFLKIERNDESTGLFNSYSQSKFEDLYKSFFHRKSINNIQDRFNFAKLCCPKKFLLPYFFLNVFYSLIRSLYMLIIVNIKNLFYLLINFSKTI